MRSGPHGIRGGRRPGGGWTALAGVIVALAYLAGAAISGRHDPLARRPLLDGLAPPPPYHWVRPPPELAAGNKPPSAARAVVRLTATGSEVSAIATDDGQASLVLEANAIPPATGADEVAVTITPVDPATLAPPPSGLVIAGNAYRIRLAYLPSGAAARLSGRATAVLVFPLLATPISSPFDYTMLASADGKAWTRQASTATPGAHQVATILTAPGYVVAAVPPASAAAPAPNRVPLIAALAGAAAVVLVAAAVLARRRRRSGYDEEDYDDEDYDDEDEEDGDGLGPDHGAEERR